MMRVHWQNRRFFMADIEPGRGLWSDRWLWTLYRRGEIVGKGYAEDRNEAIAQAAMIADKSVEPIPFPN